jgi:DNA-binding transcriptional MerR regulator
MDKSLSQITFEFFGAREETRDVLPEQSMPAPKPAIKNTRGRKSLKDTETEAEQVEVPEDEILFQKQYYSIGEVASMFKVNTSLIRYWENEFDILEPRKNRKGDRFFKPSDVKNLQMIHDLLRRRKFTIEGAKDYIRKNKQAREKYEMIQSLQKLRAFLLELKANL